MAELEKTLSFRTILIITINSIMGTGIFFLPAIGAREAGPASIISWLLMSAIAFIFGFIFAELVGMYPVAGGVYEYSKQAFGNLLSFLFGWMTLVAGNVTIAMLVVGAVRYLNPTLPNSMKIAISILFVLLFNFMAYRGMKTSAVMLVAFGTITLITLFALIIPGIIFFNPALLQPFTQPIDKILLTVFLIAETFFGWETATFLAEETKDAKRVMPRALWIGTTLIILIVLLFVVTSIGSIPWQEFGNAATPLSMLAMHHYGERAATIFSLLVYLSIIGSVASWVVSAPRLVMSLAKDKLFIAQLASVHEKFNTPHRAILFQAIVTSLLVIVGSASYESLLELLIPLVLILYSGVLLTFIILRRKKREVERPFKLFMGVPLAILALFLVGGLFFIWITHEPTAFTTLKLMGSFIAMGIPVYLLLTFYYNPYAVIQFTEFFAYLSLWMENLFLPRSVRHEVLGIFKNIEQKHVLEYGAGVGTLTLMLAERVGPKGRVIATDISAKNLRILEERLKKLGVNHVKTIHDPHQVNRVHPDVREVDFVFSVGMLSYIQDLQKVLRDIKKILPEHGRICFVEYIDYFRILPNPKWLSNNETLREIFREAGFAVQISKIRGIFWNYLFIYGHKRGYDEKDVPYI